MTPALCLLGDITRLPLASGAVDAVISLRTVYHVPRAEQTRAIDELARVTRPGGRIVVVYVWASSAAMNLVFGLRRKLGLIRHSLSRKGGPAMAAMPADAAMPALYFSPQDYDWYARDVAARHGARLKVWSAASMTFQTRFFSARDTGPLSLALVKLLEGVFPRLAGLYGQYPMFVIDKPGAPSD